MPLQVITCVCRCCGASFDSAPAQAHARRYCSRACSNRGRGSANRRVCVVCGAAFRQPPCYRDRTTGLYCSTTCAGFAARVPLEARFRQQEGRHDDPEGCFNWTGTLDDKGYGRIRADAPERRQLLAHRVAWMLATGEEPGTRKVCHRCDNPRCVRPDHLFLGTQKDNMADCRAKDRNNRGERNGGVRLNESEVREIRRAYDEDGLTQQALADRFGVSMCTINEVIHRKRWVHIP